VQCTKPDAAIIVSTGDCSARLTVGDTCNYIAEVVECTVTATDPLNGGRDAVAIQIGKVILDIGETTVSPDTDSLEATISLTNNDHMVKALDFKIGECQDGEDNLACTGCFPDPDRALGFTCTAAEQPDGTCRVVLYSPAGLIAPGEGQIATVIYDQINPEACPDCVCLQAMNVQMADQYNEALCACTDTGEVCFNVCGDIFPQDCLDPGCAPCGDGDVNLFDILEMVDIVLGLQAPTACQRNNGDVPNGMPPYCGNPPGAANCERNGNIDIYDLLVIIDMALGKMNCCDYCLSGQIY
jgi:hypothetical protein